MFLMMNFDILSKMGKKYCTASTLDDVGVNSAKLQPNGATAMLVLYYERYRSDKRLGQMTDRRD